MSGVWILGGGGLLGTSLRAILAGEDGVRLFAPAMPLQWGQGEVLHAQLEQAVGAFAASLCAGEDWAIYWAAGIGTMGSAAEAMAAETAAFAHLLQQIGADPVLRAHRGAIGLASSAGAIYAGSDDVPISEDSADAPTTPYARAKLAQERLLSDFVAASSSVAALSARISTLYGCAQAGGKRQGLLSIIARSIVRNQPVQIFVPFDTVRDYITADDAAAALVQALRAAPVQAALTTKIVASETPATIAEIISLFRKVARRPPRIFTSVTASSKLYTRCIQFRSRVLRADAVRPRTSLLIGIAQLLEAERARFVRAVPAQERQHAGH